jgi:hypothetical protein
MFGIVFLLVISITYAGVLNNYGKIVGTITVLPPPITTIILHPSNANDTTDHLYILSPADLAKLNSSDDNQYVTQKDWKEKYDDNEYIDFGFTPNIPESVIITNVTLIFEWQRPNTVDNAQLKIYVNNSLLSTISLSPLPSPNVDRNETIDLKTLGINTTAKVNALKIRFQATDGHGSETKHDLVEIIVKYVRI